MVTIDSGVLDRTRLVSNILMIALVAGNIFFSIQYTESLKRDNSQPDNNVEMIKTSRLLKLFIGTVLNPEGKAISYDDRISLENDVRQTHDVAIIKAWGVFVDSADPKVAQKNAVVFMKLLTDKLLTS